MENRYLFRAKRKDNGEWMEGLIWKAFGELGILSSDGRVSGYIIPSTICQCTGLKDNEGTLIFENDVLSLKDEINECEWKAVVKFGNPNAEYTWGWQLVPITECDANKDILLWVETEMGYMYCEIIGNRFDNPELLEGGND